MKTDVTSHTHREKLIVIGNGMAGGRLLEELKNHAPERFEITVFGDEAQACYDRIQLSSLLAGEKSLSDIMLHASDWYAANGIEFRKGERVTRIDLAGRQVRAANGEFLDYDRLVLATGSTPFIPPMKGVDLPGVLAYRTIEDVDAMLAAARDHRHALVVGGGLLGLEAAWGLKQRGMDVTVAQLSNTLMDRQLDAEAGGLLQQTLEQRGIQFRMGVRTEVLLGRKRVESVRFADGSEMPADLVVVTAGVRPNMALAQAAGLVTGRGIIVDDRLQTSDPQVFAVGECVEHRGQCFGLVAPLYEQAAVLARQLGGDTGAAYEGTVTATRLKVTGIELFSAGDISGDAGCANVIFRDPETASYKKLVFRDDQLVGAVLYGDVIDGAWYFDLIQTRRNISTLRHSLIFGEALCNEVQQTLRDEAAKTATPESVLQESDTMSNKQTLVVVGNGMVGHHFIESLVDKGGLEQFEVVTFCEEPRQAYDRVHLSEYFGGKTAEDLSMVTPGFYEQHGVKVHVGDAVSAIELDDKRVLSANGQYVNYDKLVLATGSYAFVPPIDGHDKEGCLVYRTIEDLEAIKAAAAKGKVGVVVGGGLLGLEAANALTQLGLETHVVEFAPRLMPVQLDEGGGDMLRKKIEALGVTVHLQKHTTLIDEGEDHLLRMNFADGETLETDLILFSAGIRPRDELARMAGLEVGERGGIVINSQCQTSDKDVYAIGECALWNKQIFGLVAPGYTMARAVVDHMMGNIVVFSGADMSTKLKLMGVDVGSIGDAQARTPGALTYTYVDEPAQIYQRMIVSENKKWLLGAVLVGDNSRYDTLLQYMLNNIALPENPDDLILPQRDGSAPVGLGPHALPATAQICSCYNVTKSDIVAAMDAGCCSVGEVKGATHASTGCGGCAALLKTVVDSELTKRGVEVSTDICEHFPHTRQDLYNIIRIEGIKTFKQLLDKHGKGRGCDICKPLVGSLLASTWNDYVLQDQHRSLQDTNDFALGNIQKDGTYSVVPRIPGGEITPRGLIKIGEVGEKYKLYTKITGGQRIDMFGARLEQLPLIWKELTDAGFESGHAYGKALRTVKSCVGSTWCRYGVQDSVGQAIALENRYKGLRTPHKVKFGVSGCTRECAEAQSKDIGVIAVENGWNLYVCGNGGMKPRHADLLATDLDDETLVKYIDRVLMFYIRTADRLQRTSVWMENMEGGLDYLKQVVVEDSLGLGEELEEQMQHIVDTYQDEWKTTVDNPDALKRFRSFVNSDKGDDNVVFIEERGQVRPATAEERQLAPANVG